ncbi:MAG: hypothetical protein R3F31_18410 [Verrucomicrobiales bacterium]
MGDLTFMALSVTPAEFFRRTCMPGIAGVTRGALSEDDSERVLKRAFDESLEDLPGDTADLLWQPKVAAQALHSFYRLWKPVPVDRAMTDEQVRAHCATVPAASHAPSDLLSADVTLRHLPELHGMAKSMSSGDPLIKGIEEAARRFIECRDRLQPSDVAAIQRHAGLWRLYIDRIIDHQDVSRLADERALLYRCAGRARAAAAGLALASVTALPPIHEPNPPANS